MSRALRVGVPELEWHTVYDLSGGKADNVVIGDKRLVSSTTFFVVDEREVRLRSRIGNEDVAFSLRFVAKDSDKQEGEAQVTWEIVSAVVRLTFKGWRNPLGLTVAEPTKLGEASGVVFYFQVAQHWMAAGNLVHFFVLVDNTTETT